MDLKTYLAKNQIELMTFAKQIGVSRQGLVWWLDGTRTPRWKNVKRIRDATYGAVQPNDFLPPSEAAE